MTNPAVGLTWSDDLLGRSAAPGENPLKYMSLLVDAGLTPVLITPRSRDRVVARVDGLLLPGGPDIAPQRYGQEAGERLGEVLPDLDSLELELFHAARARSLPVFGICRGQQLINVALGGTLHQHVDHPQWDDDAAKPVHQVTIAPRTRLRRLLGTATVEVNSGHHQAVDAIAEPLHACAQSADGVVEALEAEELLVISVQWHPDEMRTTESSRRLMAGFREWLGLSA